MKKLLVILTVFLYVSLALSQETKDAVIYEAKILEKLIRDVTKKPFPYVYFSGMDKKKIQLIKKYTSLRETKNQRYADFILIKNIKNWFSVKKPTLALDFNSLKYCNRCIGVFAWRNGRPILILFKENLDRLRIVLPEEYKYFMENKIITIGKK